MALEDQKHLLSRLVILSCPHPIMMLKNISLNQIKKSFYFALFQIPYIPEWFFSLNDYEFVASIVKHNLDVAKSHITDGDCRIMQYLFSRQGTPTAGLNYYRNIFALTAESYRLYSQTKLSIPCLVIWGENDGCLRPDLNDNLDTIVSRVQVHVISGGSHFIQQDRPNDVNQLISRFVLAQ